MLGYLTPCYILTGCLLSSSYFSMEELNKNGKLSMQTICLLISWILAVLCIGSMLASAVAGIEARAPSFMLIVTALLCSSITMSLSVSLVYSKVEKQINKLK